ncbi:hypothetical protein PVAP13_9KG492800 [Panicum virgatum]|uniref:Uncharacterized protein n=1 Tax=Panicum virgatum TaxID=38727 RepID=A0A8T0NUE7_PANVG|nr:hypothetical protein PVAP13_9KG492800 [Panicum virgatum]
MGQQEGRISERTGPGRERDAGPRSRAECRPDGSTRRKDQRANRTRTGARCRAAQQSRVQTRTPPPPFVTVAIKKKSVEPNNPSCPRRTSIPSAPAIFLSLHKISPAIRFHRLRRTRVAPDPDASDLSAHVPPGPACSGTLAHPGGGAGPTRRDATRSPLRSTRRPGRPGPQTRSARRTRTLTRGSCFLVLPRPAASPVGPSPRLGSTRTNTERPLAPAPRRSRFPFRVPRGARDPPRKRPPPPQAPPRPYPAHHHAVRAPSPVSWPARPPRRRRV